VIDKTGLEGLYDVTLEWAPDPALMQSPEALATVGRGDARRPDQHLHCTAGTARPAARARAGIARSPRHRSARAADTRL